VMGVVWGGRLQLATTVIKTVGVGLIALAPFVLHLWTGSSVSSANYGSKLSAATRPAPVDEVSNSVSPDYQSASGDRSLFMRFGIVLLFIMWAYNGWHGITPVAEEIRDPQRNIPLALFGGIGILIVLYVAANVAYHGVLSMDQMAAAGENATYEVAEKLWAGWGGAMITAIILCSVFGAINANLLLAPRVAFAMGRDRTFFGQLGQVHARYRTPATAIVVQALMAVALVVASGFLTNWVTGVVKARISRAVAGEPEALQQRVEKAIAGKERNLTAAVSSAIAGEPLADRQRILRAIQQEDTAIRPRLLREIVARLENKSIFDLLTNFVIFAGSIFYSLCVLAVIILRFKHPEWPRPYRTWGYPVIPLLFLAFYAWFLTVVFIGEPFEALAGIALIALGLPVHWWWNRRNNPRTANLQH